MSGHNIGITFHLPPTWTCHRLLSPQGEKSRTPPPHAAAAATADTINSDASDAAFVAHSRTLPPPPRTATARRTTPPPPPQTPPPMTMVRPWLQHMKVNESYLFNFTHALCTLLFCCLLIFRRSCQEGQMFWGRSLIVSSMSWRMFFLYLQLSGRVWLRCIWHGNLTKDAPWIALVRESLRSYTSRGFLPETLIVPLLFVMQSD